MKYISEYFVLNLPHLLPEISITRFFWDNLYIYLHPNHETATNALNVVIKCTFCYIKQHIRSFHGNENDQSAHGPQRQTFHFFVH